MNVNTLNNNRTIDSRVCKHASKASWRKIEMTYWEKVSLSVLYCLCIVYFIPYISWKLGLYDISKYFRSTEPWFEMNWNGRTLHPIANPQNMYSFCISNNVRFINWNIDSILIKWHICDHIFDQKVFFRRKIIHFHCNRVQMEYYVIAMKMHPNGLTLFVVPLHISCNFNCFRSKLFDQQQDERKRISCSHSATAYVEQPFVV